jgi:hypothetical protein
MSLYLALLSNVNLEKHVIRMVVTPAEVFPPLVAPQSMELAIIAMPLTQVEPVSTIFLDGVDVIVAAIPIVVPLLKVVVRLSDRD